MKIIIKFKKERPVKIKAILLLVLFLFSTAVASEKAKNWMDVAKDIEVSLQDALKTYRKGDKNNAMTGVADAYFSIFEGEYNMEIAVRRHISLKRAVALEKSFVEIRKSMANGASFSGVREKVLKLTGDVKKAAKELDGKGVSLKTDL